MKYWHVQWLPSHWSKVQAVFSMRIRSGDAESDLQERSHQRTVGQRPRCAGQDGRRIFSNTATARFRKASCVSRPTSGARIGIQPIRFLHQEPFPLALSLLTEFESVMMGRPTRRAIASAVCRLSA